MEFFGYGPQAICPVTTDRSDYDRHMRGQINPYTLIALDILWALRETQRYAQKPPINDHFYPLK